MALRPGQITGIPPAPVVASSSSGRVESTRGTQINLRTYRPKDHQIVVEMFAAGMMSYAVEYGEEIQQLWRGYVNECLQTDLADIPGTYFATKGHFWVATTVEDGQEVVVGCVGLEGKDPGEVELRRMSVKREYRRYGVGRVLVRGLEAWCQEQGLHRIWLSTGEVMVQACKFYEALGYHNFKTELVSLEPLFVAKYFEKLLTPAANSC